MSQLNYFTCEDPFRNQKSKSTKEKPMPEVRETEFVLAPGEYAYIADQNSGALSVSVGPCKVNLQMTDQPMVFDADTNRFERCQNVRDAIQFNPTADERSYIILDNPSTADDNPHPKPNAKNTQVPLNYGKKIIIHGPNTFALWPGQMARVVAGHQLRSNEYLVIKIYNAEEAMKHAADLITATEDIPRDEATPTPKLETGQLFIIKGTECSFYIPPTGIEVADDNGKWVRDAITLERLEYCILRDENGVKRYVKGPEVVFPSPTEIFVEINGAKKFKALELNEQMGIHIKCIADYKDEDGTNHKAGEELHITGKEQKIYYPRAEHAIIKYGDQIIQYAVAIPKGEGRYVLEKSTGDVKLVKGPEMFLPNPIEAVMVRRVLSPKQVELWFPGNQEAIRHNQELSALAKNNLMMDMYGSVSNSYAGARGASGTPGVAFAAMAADMMAADEVTRKTSYTPPRTITLDTKFDGAVCIDVWPGYAVQVVSKSGEREVVQGPRSFLLEYDQTLEVLSLSRGKPKSTKDLLRTPYLKVQNNRVSDLVEAETKDLVPVNITVFYRVNFEGDSTKWFSTENYVQFLADHLRSMIRNAIKKVGIEEVTNNATDLIRDTVLNKPVDGLKRTGRSFEENGMRVYDVEVLNVIINNPSINSMLVQNQHQIVSKSLESVQKTKLLEVTKATTEAEKQILDLTSSISLKKLEITDQENGKRTEIENKTLEAKKNQQAVLDTIQKAELSRREADSRLVQDIEIKNRESLTKEFVAKLQAIEPDLIAAINNASRMALMQELVSNLPQATGGLGFLLGKGGMDAIGAMIKGNPVLEGAMSDLIKTESNGKIK